MALAILFLLQDWDTVRMETQEPVHTITARDVDGDGRADLVLQAGKDIHIHRAGGGAFAQKPDATLRLSADTFLWTFARIDGRTCLVTATSRGLLDHPWRDGEPEEIVIHPNLFEGASSEKQPPLLLDFMPDLDGDGRDDALLFQRDEIWTMRQQEGGAFRLTQQLPLP